jgi:heme ABC exporter ATP-binding subunit CcmA
MESALEDVGTRAGVRSAPPALRLGNLRRDYGERPVLRGLSIELPVGATLAVIGPNGAGKTTLLRILATLLRPTAGRVSVLGAELPAQAWRARGRIGYLGHQPLLYRELTVRENLDFNARLHAIASPSERIAELLERAGLAHRGDEPVRNLSAGMLQRAAVCRTLLHEPELLLLDEPRAHLDLQARPSVDAMLAAAPGRSRVLVTHDVEHALEQADLLLALRADGTSAYAGDSSRIEAGDARAMYGGAP